MTRNGPREVPYDWHLVVIDRVVYMYDANSVTYICSQNKKHLLYPIAAWDEDDEPANWGWVNRREAPADYWSESSMVSRHRLRVGQSDADLPANEAIESAYYDLKNEQIDHIIEVSLGDTPVEVVA